MLLSKAHISFLENLQRKNLKISMEAFLATPLKMGGVYWAIGSAALLGHPLPDVLEFLTSCRNPDGGYGPDSGHDSHATSTHYALLAISMIGAELTETEKQETANFFKSLQADDGSISGDLWGERDLRFAYDAVAGSEILGVSTIERVKLREWIGRCRNWDGGYAPAPELESHAAYTFCAIGALCLSGGMGLSDEEVTKTAWWLAERQTPHGGFNGRPEKAPDVCYSWWILASLQMLGKAHWVDKDALRMFVLKAQDEEDGGISDRPGFAADVFHTFFGLAALSLIGKDDLVSIDPRFAIPSEAVPK